MTRSGAFFFLAGMVLAGAAQAANDGRPDPDLRIDALTTYATQAEADRSCRGDAVVWADRFSGFFYERNEPNFGATPAGGYACRSEAGKAHYWSTDPRASMEGHPGRNFPFDRLFYGS